MDEGSSNDMKPAGQRHTNGQHHGNLPLRASSVSSPSFVATA